jgi:hypothetical protein
VVISAIETPAAVRIAPIATGIPTMVAVAAAAPTTKATSAATIAVQNDSIPLHSALTERRAHQRSASFDP